MLKTTPTIAVFLIFSLSAQADDESEIAKVRLYHREAVQAQNEGNYGRAEKFHRETLAAIKKLEKVPSSEVARTMSNLGSVLNIQKKYQEANDILTNAVELLEKHPSSDREQYAVLYGNLAEAQFNLGRANDAEENFTKALNIAMESSGPESSFVASDKAGLATIWVTRGKYEDAKKYYEEALVVFRKYGGPNHPIVRATEEKYQVLLLKIKDSLAQVPLKSPK